MSIVLLILGLVLFILLIVVHEFGHFWIARRNGVEAEEFGIFFPPRLYKHKTKDGWLFSINIIPLGGFVRLKGESDSATGKGTFGAASFGVKAKIMLAGVVMNLVVAFVLFTALAWLGMPQLVDNQYTIKSDTHYAQRAQVTVTADQIEKNSPASTAGIKSNDTLLAMGPAGKLQTISNVDQLLSDTSKYAGQTIQVRYKHNGVDYTKTLTLRSKAQVDAAKKAGVQEGYLGVVLDESQKGLTLTRSTWSAPVVAGGLIVQFTALTFHGLGTALAGLGSTIAGIVTGNHAAREAGQTAASGQVAGPVGIFEILKIGSGLGYQFVLMIVAVISLTLAIMNVLPIPALDGGKLFVTAIARAMHKKLSESAEAAIYGGSIAVILVLFVLITIVDVRRL